MANKKKKTRAQKKGKKHTKKRTRKKGKVRRAVAPPQPTPSLTLPHSLTLEQIQLLNTLLEQRRVIIKFRDAEPGTLYIKRRGDEEDMEVGLLRGSKSEMKLRAILSDLISKTEGDLEDLGIDLDELDPDTGADEDEGPTGAGDEDDDEGEDEDEEGGEDEGEGE